MTETFEGRPVVDTTVLPHTLLDQFVTAMHRDDKGVMTEMRYRQTVVGVVREEPR